MQRWATRAIVGVFGAAATAGLFARIMNYEMRNDEQLYATPVALLDQSKLYQDVFYNHVPGSAWAFNAVGAFIGSDQVLLPARLGVFFGWMVFAAFLIWSTVKLTGSRALAALLVVLVVANDYLLGVTGVTATNNFLPLPFAYAGLTLFVLGAENAASAASRRTGFVYVLIAGMCLSIAASFKASAAAFILPTAIASLLLPPRLAIVERLKWVTTPLAIGGIVAASPVLLLMARDPATFFAHVLEYHTVAQPEYWAAARAFEPSVAFAAPAKALLAHQIYFTGANLLLLSVVALAMVSTAGAPNATPSAAPRRAFADRLALFDASTLFVLAAAAIAALLAFAPTPSFPQYFAPPLIAAPLLAALLFRRLDASARTRIEPALIGLAALAGLAFAPRVVQYLPALAKPEKWTVNRVHQTGEDIAAALAAQGRTGPVATFFPVYPLEAGLEVYPEFATGQFAYRVGDLIEPKLRDFYVTTSPNDLRAFFEASPPAAILVGFSEHLEAPLIDYAAANGYAPAKDFQLTTRYGEATLYLRPRGADASQ